MSGIEEGIICFLHWSQFDVVSKEQFDFLSPLAFQLSPVATNMYLFDQKYGGIYFVTFTTSASNMAICYFFSVSV